MLAALASRADKINPEDIAAGAFYFDVSALVPVQWAPKWERTTEQYPEAYMPLGRAIGGHQKIALRIMEENDSGFTRLDAGEAAALGARLAAMPLTTLHIYARFDDSEAARVFADCLKDSETLQEIGLHSLERADDVDAVRALAAAPALTSLTVETETGDEGILRDIIHAVEGVSAVEILAPFTKLTAVSAPELAGHAGVSLLCRVTDEVAQEITKELFNSNCTQITLDFIDNETPFAATEGACPLTHLSLAPAPLTPAAAAAIAARVVPGAGLDVHVTGDACQFLARLANLSTLKLTVHATLTGEQAAAVVATAAAAADNDRLIFQRGDTTDLALPVPAQPARAQSLAVSCGFGSVTGDVQPLAEAAERWLGPQGPHTCHMTFMVPQLRSRPAQQRLDQARSQAVEAGKTR